LKRKAPHKDPYFNPTSWIMVQTTWHFCQKQGPILKTDPNGLIFFQNARFPWCGVALMDRASSLDQPHIVLECCISAFIDMYCS
jgi:hypothetical protein